MQFLFCGSSRTQHWSHSLVNRVSHVSTPLFHRLPCCINRVYIENNLQIRRLRPSNARGTVTGFLGIPYAQPPVRNLRFKVNVFMLFSRLTSFLTDCPDNLAWRWWAPDTARGRRERGAIDRWPVTCMSLKVNWNPLVFVGRLYFLPQVNLSRFLPVPLFLL